MSLWGIIKLAFISLSRNKMRSFLTALGIIIGVTSVVAMVGLGQGAYYSVQNSIAKMGTNLIMILPGAQMRRGFHGPRGSSTTLVPQDIVAISKECPSVSKICPMLRSIGQVVFGNKNWSTSIMGVNEDFMAVRSREVAYGRNLTNADVRNASKVCILGQTVVDNLFGNLNPIGQTIRFKAIPLTVIGVLKENGESTMGRDQDDLVIVPWTMVQKRILGITNLHMAFVSAKNEKLVSAAQEEIRKVLHRRHHIKHGEDDDFHIRTQEDIAQMAGSTLAIFSLFLGSVASVSLLVGGIGIMNIMLVSVTERTREIGIRMAIGAKTKDILFQFLVESVTLSCLGGIIGIFGGIGLSKIIAHFIKFPPVISVWAIVISFIFSAMVGIFFGLYPAWKASQLDPIEAFRFE